MAKLIPTALEAYFQKTRSHFFGLLAIFLLLVIYEAGSAKIYADEKVVISNSAEVMMQRFLWFVGIRNNLFLWAVYILGLAWAFYLAKKQNLLDFKFVYIPYSIFESTLYAVLVDVIAGQLANRTKVFMMMAPQAEATVAAMSKELTRSIGAGIYEELLFRLILVSLFLVTFQKLEIFGENKILQSALAVALAAALFSGFHFLGGNEVAAFEPFIFRFYAGVLLGILFVVRGIGVTSYTHAIYNVLLVLR